MFLSTLTFAQGYHDALAAHGYTPDTQQRYALRPSLDGACEDMLAYLSSGMTVPAALFADNDVIAAGAMRALTLRGFSIPRDVSIIGVDNTPLALTTTPPLSSMQISRFTLGKHAFRVLLDQLRHPGSEHIHIRIGAQLVSRRSVREG